MKITRPWGCSRLQSYKRFQRPHVPSGLLVPQHDSPTPPMTWDFHVRWQGRISKTTTFFHCRCFQCRFVLKITVSKQCDSGLPKLELRQAIPRSSSTTAWAMKPHLFQPEGNWCEKTSPPKKMVFFVWVNAFIIISRWCHDWDFCIHKVQSQPLLAHLIHEPRAWGS